MQFTSVCKQKESICVNSKKKKKPSWKEKISQKLVYDFIVKIWERWPLCFISKLKKKKKTLEKLPSKLSCIEKASSTILQPNYVSGTHRTPKTLLETHVKDIRNMQNNGKDGSSHENSVFIFKKRTAAYEENGITNLKNLVIKLSKNLRLRHFITLHNHLRFFSS